MRKHDFAFEKVLVTGAGGFIGSHIVQALLQEHIQVRALVHGDAGKHAGHLSDYVVNATNSEVVVTQNPSSNWGIKGHLEITGGNLCDASFVNKAVAGADAVIHTGAVTSVAYAFAHPIETIQSNVIGTTNICNAALECNVKRMINTSTAGVYATQNSDIPITETSPTGGWNPYSASKLAADHIVQSFYCSYDLPVITLRLFNTYGPRMGRYLIMPTIIEQLHQGKELHLGDLSPHRTFVYVDDVVDGYLRALSVSDNSILGEVVHLSGQESISMRDLVDCIADIMQKEYQLVCDDTRLRPHKTEINQVNVDISKAERLLGWSPATSLKTGLTHTIAWFCSLLTGSP